MMPHLLKVKPVMQKMGISACAQNCSKTAEGAFTGEVSVGQLADARVDWTLVGHSERRAKYGESDQDVADKVEKALAAGLKVVVAIGESLEEREGGKTNEVNERQLAPVLKSIKVEEWSKIVIAYEPVWDAELISKPNIDGFLVGGASLKASFMDIILKSIPPTPLKKPTFVSVKTLNPGSRGVNFMVKCTKAAAPAEGTEGVFEAQVGDDTGVVTVSFRDKELCSVCTEGASIRIQNASVKMVKGYVRLSVDKWAAFKAADSPLDFEVKAKNDMSTTEYELVAS
eukprot:CAMPEP_0115075994 /NCGR_PEP_ID=MMETSP0227-20121206/16185_1 /TAXON_ID=89957 /ORGANISM="Polarella glacialis, Strain CCMP 1383" /LENGTH=284 /DNA_ID=CAMNT_0002463095 /DNA_START=1 /DNA_END=856 /DNA_ORIENTATION=+